jgi:hypothetical protein
MMGCIYHAEIYSVRTAVLVCLYMLVSIYGCESLSVCLQYSKFGCSLFST